MTNQNRRPLKTITSSTQISPEGNLLRLWALSPAYLGNGLGSSVVMERFSGAVEGGFRGPHSTGKSAWKLSCGHVPLGTSLRPSPFRNQRFGGALPRGPYLGFLRRYGAWKRKHFLNTPSRRKKVTGIKVMRGVGCEWLETMSWGQGWGYG